MGEIEGRMSFVFALWGIKRITHMLRVASICGRAVIVFIAAKILDPMDYAGFIIVSAYSALYVILIGLDYTRYIQPDVVEEYALSKRDSIFNMYKFTTVVAFIFFLTCVVAFYGFNFPQDFIFGLVLLTLFEYASQEAGRLLVALNMQLSAAISLAIRTTLPAAILILIFLLNEEPSIMTVYFIMGLCGLFSFFVSWTILFGGKLKEFLGLGFPEVGWQAIKISIFFFLSTIIARVAFTLDKSLVGEKFGYHELASYGLALSAAMIIVPVIDIIICSYVVPKFIRLSIDNNPLLQEIYRGSILSALKIIIPFFVFAPVVFYIAADYIFPEYGLDDIYTMYCIFALTSIYALSTIPTALLVARRKSGSMAVSAVPTIFIIFVFFWAANTTIFAFVFSFMMSFFLMLLWRMKLCRQIFLSPSFG